MNPGGLITQRQHNRLSHLALAFNLFRDEAARTQTHAGRCSRGKDFSPPRATKSIRRRAQTILFNVNLDGLGNGAPTQNYGKGSGTLTVKETRGEEDWRPKEIQASIRGFQRRKQSRCRERGLGTDNRDHRGDSNSSQFPSKGIKELGAQNNRMQLFAALESLSNDVLVTDVNCSFRGHQVKNDDRRVQQSLHFNFSSMNSARRLPPSPVSGNTSPDPPR